MTEAGKRLIEAARQARASCGDWWRAEMTEDLIHTRWRHLKRGTTYEVIGIAKLQTALSGGLADETTMVVYRAEATGALFVRSLGEFNDGRFERYYPMFECPDCGGDLADKGHLPTCIQKDKEPDFNSRPNT